jgi:hypothetical protein
LPPVATGQYSKLIDLSYKDLQGLVPATISVLSLFDEPAICPSPVSYGRASRIGPIPPPLEIDRDCLLTILRAIESVVDAPADNSFSRTVAEFLFVAFDHNLFDLRARITDVMHLLCKSSPPFVAALLDIGPIRVFLSVLDSPGAAKLLLNLIDILASFYSIHDGPEICEECDVFVAIAQFFLGNLQRSGPESTQMILSACCDLFHKTSNPEVCGIFAEVLRKGADFLYPHVDRFVHNFVEEFANEDEGVNELLDRGLGIDLFARFFEGAHLFRSVASILTVTTDSCRQRLVEFLSGGDEMPPIASFLSEIFLDGCRDEKILADAICCYEKVGTILSVSFDLLTNVSVMGAFAEYVDNGNFGLRYATAHCLFTAVAAARPHVARSLFGSRVMVDALSLFEYDTGDLLSEILKAVGATLAMIHRVGLLHYRFFDEFERELAGILKELLTAEDENVRAGACAIANDNFPDLKYREDD